MIIYICIFLLSTISTYIAEFNIKKKKKNFPLFIISSIVAILFPVLLATFRDPGVGTDTLGYVQEVWNQFTRLGNINNILYAYQNGEFYDFEIVYLLINAIAIIFGNDIHWLYFITSLFIILPIYIAIYNNRHRAPMWIGMIFFLLLYYNYSLNMVRQSVALAFCIYSFKYVEQKKWIKLFIWLLIIINTHNTGIFYLLFIAIYLISYIPSKYLKNILLFISYFSIILIFSAFDFLLIISVSWGIISDKYLIYLTNNNQTDLDLTTTIEYLFIILISYISLQILRKKIIQYNEVNNYIKYEFLGTLLFCAALISQWAFRLSFYFNYPIDCLFLPRMFMLVKCRSKSLYQLLLLITIGFLLLVWYWTTVITKVNEVYPYKSELLGI